jgi:site-specific DNA recombinase
MRTKGMSNQSGGTFIYCRISLDKSGELLGVERQEKTSRELCERMGWTVADVIVDNDLSATTGVRRPGFEDLLVRNPERIVVWHTDRLARRIADLERVITLGVEIHSVMGGGLDLSGASGRLNARLLTSVATFEGEHKAERQRAQQYQRIERGGSWWSQRPFGYEMDRTQREDEAALIVRGYERMLSGTTRWIDLSDMLNHAGALTTKGNAWTPTTTAQLFRSPRNAALLTTAGGMVQGDWPPIVGEDTWKASLHLMGDASMRGRGQGTRKGLLSGIARCAECEATVHLRTRRTEARGLLRKIYGCDNGHASAPAEWLDDQVGKAIVRRLLSPAGIYAFSHAESAGEDRTGAVLKAASLRAQLDDVADAFATGEITREQLARASSRLRADLETAEQEAQRTYLPTPLGTIDGPASALAAWRRDDMPLDERRAVVLYLLKSVEIHRRVKGVPIATKHVTMKWRKW